MALVLLPSRRVKVKVVSNGPNFQPSRLQLVTFDLLASPPATCLVQLLPMKPSINKLYKFLKLEIEQNYNNRAVIGGLEKILAAWEVEARSDGLSEDAIREVGNCLREYNGLEPAQRSLALDTLWQHLRGFTNENLPALPAPTQESKPVDKPMPPPRSPRRETN